VNAHPCTTRATGRTAALVLLMTALAIPGGRTSAQASLDVRPVVSRTEDREFSLGARWEGSVEPGARTTLALSFPRELWWGARGSGAWLSKAGAETEPLVDAEGEVGLQVLLLRQRPCLPQDCPADLVGLDLGYVALVARVQGESDRGADETMAAAGGALLYRPPFAWSSDGLGFLVPTLSLGIGAAWPGRSALRDALGAGRAGFTRVDLAAGWTVRLDRSGMPRGLRPLRLDAHVAHFSHGDLEAAIVDSVGSRGRFVAFDVGYELSGRAGVVRHAFVRWSEGEHATLPTGRRGWLLGITIGGARRSE
jgi:hypothetical protein